MADSENSKPAREVSPRRINSVDLSVGQRLKLRRVSLGWSQDELSGMIGISFQQLQKYENGQNRISAGRLFGIAKALNVPVGWFFEAPAPLAELELGVDALGGSSRQETDPAIINSEGKEVLELIELYFSMSQPEKRRRLMRTVRFMANELDES